MTLRSFNKYFILPLLDVRLCAVYAPKQQLQGPFSYKLTLSLHSSAPETYLNVKGNEKRDSSFIG